MKEKYYFTPEDIKDINYEKEISNPGKFPFTRGIHETMYKGKLWTMRQYAGYGTAKETNERFKYLLSKGQTGLSIAFDLPTQLGMDSDHPFAKGEVGKVGVAVSTILDMEEIFEGIELDKVSTSMTINATANIILAMYILVAKKKGVSENLLSGTVQNDPLKEFLARGNYIFPPKESLRLSIDIWEYCIKNIPKWYFVSISGYHIREKGATASQEIAFTFANAIEYIENALSRGLDIDKIGERISFFFGVHNSFFEEIAKFRAARKIWARIMKERFKAKNENSMKMRFHTQTCGSTLTYQEPHNNIIRVTLQALAAILGGTQSLHTNSFDEAIGLPSREAVKIALRTQQIIAYESKIPEYVDPLGGSYLIERLTKDKEEEIMEIIKDIEERGGALKCVETGYMKKLIEESAYKYQRNIEEKKEYIVGVNIFKDEEVKIPSPEIKISEEIEEKRKEFLKKFREKRNKEEVKKYLDIIKEKAHKGENLMPYIKEGVEKNLTLGEICEALKEVFGEYKEKE
ncbi:MAG: methylmalonyl-CoA mutase family protein [candidate division WOR-3 bacterium]